MTEDKTGDQLSLSEVDCLQKLKVALATTIIRNKPHGLTSKDFAQRLSSQLKSGEQNWKAKAKKLEEELLQAKQELVLAEFNKRQNDTASLVEDFYSTGFTDCQPSPSAINYDVSVLTPPSSSEALPKETHHEKIFASNANFLSSLAKLETVSSSLESKIAIDHTIGVIKQSVQNMCVYYQNWLELEHLPKCAIEKGPAAMVRVLDSSTLDGHRDELVKECELLIHCCLRSILSCRKLCRMEFLASARTLVTELARSAHLQKSTLLSVAEQVKGVSDGLRSTASQQTFLDIAQCENSICLLKTIEGIIHVDSRCGGIKVFLQQDDLKAVKEQLENCVLHLTELFPLFAQYVWNILGRLELMIEDLSEDGAE